VATWPKMKRVISRVFSHEVWLVVGGVGKCPVFGDFEHHLKPSLLKMTFSFCWVMWKIGDLPTHHEVIETFQDDGATLGFCQDTATST